MFTDIAQTLAVLGLIALIIEVVILGFSTFFLLFFGIALLLTSALIYMNIIEATWLSSISTLSIITLLLTLMLWKPLKRLQNSKANTQIDSDFAMISFELEKDLTHSDPYHYQYSGITWLIKAEDTIEKGVKVKVIRKEVGVLWVEPCDMMKND